METIVNKSRFVNLGATCYQNCILSILCHFPEGFVEYILTGNYLMNLDYKGVSIENRSEFLIYEYHKILFSFLKNDDKMLKTIDWKRLCGEKNYMFSDNNQHDAQEFLSFVIDTFTTELGTELKMIPKMMIDNSKWNEKRLVLNLLSDEVWNRFFKRSYSVLVPFFNGMMRTKIECTFCGNIKNNFNPFTILQVDIPDKENPSLEDCIKLYTSEEELDSDNLLSCDGCYNRTIHKKQDSIWKLPKYMIINFKRFKMNDYGEIVGKNTKKVEYPLEIDMKELIDNDSKYYDMDNEYYLFGVVLHNGILTAQRSGGHYRSLVRNRDDCEWYLYDDDDEPERIYEDNLVNENAYLLFYCKKN